MRPDYSRDSGLAKWGSELKLHSSNPEPLMSAMGQKQTSRQLQLECAPNGGHLTGMELTEAAGLSEDESHGQTTFP